MDSSLVYLPNEFDGKWVWEISPGAVPKQPIVFYELKRGTLGLVLEPTGLTMFHRDLIECLDEHSIGGFQRYQAVIRQPRSDAENTDYYVVKASDVTPLNALTTPAGRPSLTVLREEPQTVLVSTELRTLLEQSSLPGLRFREPMFAC